MHEYYVIKPPTAQTYSPFVPCFARTSLRLAHACLTCVAVHLYHRYLARNAAIIGAARASGAVVLFLPLRPKLQQNNGNICPAREKRAWATASCLCSNCLDILTVDLTARPATQPRDSAGGSSGGRDPLFANAKPDPRGRSGFQPASPRLSPLRSRVFAPLTAH